MGYYQESDLFMETVVLSFLGVQLDAGPGPKRWDRWRPNVALCQHEDLLIDRLILLHDRRRKKLAQQIVDDIGSVSPETKVELRHFPLRDPWDFEEVYGALFDLAGELDFDREKVDLLVNITTGSHVAQTCCFLLTESSHFPGKLIQGSPSKDQKGQPKGTYRVIDLDLSRYDQIARRFQQEHEESVSFLKSGIETRNERFNQLIDRIEEVAIKTKAPILLTGPTGAGKSHLARRIFELKKTRHQVPGEFVEVNCATLRGDGAMSGLFGHVKGAFTGAQSTRGGLLKKSDRGVLFLDEIGELGLDEQAMLLRAIEEKRFLPVGSDDETQSDFQLIAGTNRNLLQAVGQGQFREDLLARINLWTFHLPGLAQRREDIEPNIAYELSQLANSQRGKITFNREAKKAFLDFALDEDARWSGNFRDLNAALTRMATLAPGGRIHRDLVNEEIERLRASWGPGPSMLQEEAPSLPEDLAASLDLFDRVQLEEVLRVCRRSRSLSEAGRRLFAESRKKRKVANDADRLRKYLARFDLQWSDIQST